MCNIVGVIKGTCIYSYQGCKNSVFHSKYIIIEIKPLSILFLFITDFLFNWLREIIHAQPGERRGWGPGVILELTLRGEINVKITIHYWFRQWLKLHVLISKCWGLSLHKQSVKTFYQTAKVDLIFSRNWKWKILKTCFDAQIGELYLQIRGMVETLGKRQATQNKSIGIYTNDWYGGCQVRKIFYLAATTYYLAAVT